MINCENFDDGENIISDECMCYPPPHKREDGEHEIECPEHPIHKETPQDINNRNYNAGYQYACGYYD